MGPPGALHVFLVILVYFIVLGGTTFGLLQCRQGFRQLRKPSQFCFGPDLSRDGIDALSES